MFNHEPDNYKCPLCVAIKGVEDDTTMLKQVDFVYRDNFVSAFIASLWVGKNDGHVIIVPTKHIENIYDLPEDIGHRIADLSKKIAIAMKESYNCDGITLRQNNEPASEQHVFHYHLHIFPRYEGDGFNQSQTQKSRLAEPEERIPYVAKLKANLINS